MERDCQSCAVLRLVGDALEGYDQAVFSSLASGVTVTGSMIATLALMIGVMMRSHMGLDAGMGREAANNFFGTLTRLAFAMGFLASFTVWKTYVVGVLENGIYASVFAALPETEAAIATTSDNPMIPTLSKVELSIFTPVGNLWDAVVNAFSIWAPGKSTVIFLSVLAVGGFAVALMALITLYFVEMQLWVFLIGAFGPLIIFAWVFQETRGAAWMALKTLIQSGLTVLMATGVSAILIKGFSDTAAMLPISEADGTRVLDVEQLEYLAAFGSFSKLWLVELMVLMLLILIKIVAVVIVFGSLPRRIRGS